MIEEKNASAQSQDLLSAWIQSATDFWGSMLKVWSTDGGANSPDESNAFAAKRTHESLETVLRSWQTLSSIARDAGALDAVTKLGQTTPDILFKLVKSSWNSYFHFQQQWLESAGRIGQKSKAYSFDHLDKETIRAWTDIYEKEFRQFLHIPQLGLTRFYQEKANLTLDKFNLFQAALTEYLYIFYLPIEKSLKILQEELSDQAKQGNLSENYNEYYKRWIKILEGHYMTLYKSSDYLETMHRALETLEDYLASRNDIIHDLLKAYNVPTQNDLDELAKEIYVLKKRIRQLEKVPS